MKLRQKLAVVLASAMVVTSIPVVTMAASKNGLVKDAIKVAKKTTFYTTSTANAISIKFEDHDAGDKEVFYLTLDNAEWSADALNENAATIGEFTKIGSKDAWYFTTNGLQVKYEYQSKKTMKVTVETTQIDNTGASTGVANTIDPSKVYKFPLMTYISSGDAVVTINPGSSSVSEGSYKFATTSSEIASFEIDEDVIPSFHTSGEIAPIAIKENYTGALKGGATITVELDDTDFEFTNSKTASDNSKYDYLLTDVQVEGSYGFGLEAATPTVKVYMNKNDKSTVYIQVVANSATAEADSYGKLEISGLNVKSTSRTPDLGNLTASISSTELSNGADNVVVAKISDYGVNIEMKDEKAVEVVAGSLKDIEFTISEEVKDTFVGGRDFDLTLSAGQYDYRTLIAKYSDLTTSEIDKLADLTDKKVRDLDFELDVDAMRKAGLIKDEYDTISGGTANAIEAIEFERGTDGRIIPTNLIVTFNSNLAKADEEIEIDFKLPTYVSLADREAEKIEIAAAGRGIGGAEVNVAAITVKNPLEIKAEPLTVKVGLQKQVGGQITLTETAKEMLKKGDIVFSLKDTEKAGICFDGDVTLETTGGITKTEIETDEANNKAVVKVNRTSKDASVVTVKDFVMTVDRSVPQGSYDIEISGSALTEGGYESDTITIEDFIVVGTSNTEDLTASNGLAKGTSTFVIGESKYVMNGKTYEMDAASYIQNPGYTMVPVRYVAEAFGVSKADILFSSGTVTMFAGSRTVQLTNGSDKAVVNGTTIKMGTKVVIKDGRTYAPVGEVARLLGISTEWDNTTKTATFTNK